MMRSEDAAQRGNRKAILITQSVGIPLVLTFAGLVYASIFAGMLPEWVGVAAFLAEIWTGSVVIGRIRSLRKQN